MSDSILTVRDELRSLGYDAFEFDWQNGKVVAFPYAIEAGSKAGTPVFVGISFQEEGYPEYPLIGFTCLRQYQITTVEGKHTAPTTAGSGSP